LKRLLALLVAAAAACGSRSQKAAAPPPPPTVYVATATRHDVPLYIEAVASLAGYVDADIRARVRGFLQSQEYRDGSIVREGQLLFTIDQAEQAAAFGAAKANVERARAALQRNRTLLERSEGLFKTGMISQQDLDNVRTAVVDTEGQLRVAEAAQRQAQLNLSYTRIQSPIPGIAGVALVRVGNLVGQDGPTLLTTVSQLDTMRVYFPMSEMDYVRYPQWFTHVEERDLAWAKKQFTRLDASGAGDPGVQLVLGDGSPYKRRGVVVAVNRQIDASTGTIQVQALVPNPELLLRPGQYARVRMERQGEGKGVISVPEKALVAVQGTYSIGIVKPDKKVELRRVELGPSAQGERIINKGLSEGETFVVEGIQKISDGATVDPKPVATAQATQEPGRSATVR
jgi:membrane fusion protein (multidrug efflux system)